ncbi:trans-sulfuration enzyme family protein [Ponticoccus alexandrii]|uniref:Aminotransferase class I/II-fold pyridoxal phosphate-dependent enzyme n=1 Tax=Ponticoccus alexandrii TaxID=1943633 RepID=A0ABX7FA13_9RHOB|nr:aminotransferase class I/II-fold pyridoxal phosphate-dependent enzyme [Ponticoccus alexandrii]QRF66533.1 aminotransferase class I/II-fold pyridoxal phosphate-dependent enzyme [Ponticoccus alexandrii]
MKKTLQRPVTPLAGVSSPVVPGIMPSVVYASDTPDSLDAQYEGTTQGFTYAREGHPNAEMLARRIDAMEGAENGIVTGSGMAAVAAVLLGLTQTGDHVIGGNGLYGRSLRMMAEDLPRMGVTTTLVDVTRAEAVAEAIRPETRMVMIEVVSNPSLRIADLDGIATVCNEKGVLLVVDNTFTTPSAVKPFEHGADIVLHSVTKLLAGHSDATLGWVAAKDSALNERLRVFAVTTGMTASPFDCWLAERGLATFDLRFTRAQDTAQRLADMLAETPGVTRVLYPTRADHPEAARAQSLLKGRGCNMVSFEIAGGRAAANALTTAAQGIAFAPTLGDVGTTLSHPASSSHRGLTPEGRAALGISEGFFRVSVGLEDPEALLATFADGLAAARAVAG